MKKKMKQLLTIFLALTMTLTTPIIAMAENTKEPAYNSTDSYVINYARVDYDYDANAPYLYASPHMGSMGIRNLDTGEMEYWITSQQIYNMINTTKLTAGGSGAYASIPVYCTDACVSARDGYVYRRINLADSTYFDEATANHLRAIMLSSFPYIKDMRQIEAAVNAWIDAEKPEAAKISGLTGAEAITATQYTIWCVANADDIVNRGAYSYTRPYTESDLAEKVVYVSDAYVNCLEDDRETTENNIQMLHEYLMHLEGVKAEQTAVSDTTITVADVAIQKQWMDTADTEQKYTVTVMTKVDATITEASHMVLSLLSGDKNRNLQMIPGQNKYTISLSNLTAEELNHIRLEINGYQQISGVFLFDAADNRENSQSMIGYDDSSLPVHAKATVITEDVIVEEPDEPVIPETPVIPNTPTDSTPSREPVTQIEGQISSPDTSDSNVILPWYLVMIAAGGALGICVAAKTRSM
ncbi:MAG: Cys-Gln thioester bond-forming surface protein [Eubacterium sp.]|nr:Cys-Gln thioester bond-forming surface protein [Eubacterium sp.]